MGAWEIQTLISEDESKVKGVWGLVFQHESRVQLVWGSKYKVCEVWDMEFLCDNLRCPMMCPSIIFFNIDSRLEWLFSVLKKDNGHSKYSLA